MIVLDVEIRLNLIKCHFLMLKVGSEYLTELIDLRIVDD